MYDRMQTFSPEQLEKIHAASMDILSKTGVAFNDEPAIELFREKGYRVEKNTVFFTEEQLRAALATAP